MTAVSQSYPNYLGGLNEQPDELMKPGQLVEALNVIPDPVVGLTRRPGFELMPWRDVKGDLTTDPDIDPTGTWFELDFDNNINNDYVYIGCINPDTGKVTIFNQDGELQVVKYAGRTVEPHQKYLFKRSQNKLVVRDENDEVLDEIDVFDDQKYREYMEHSPDAPLKWCVSKNNMFFSNPRVSPSLSEVKPPTDADKQYYSFINLKLVDTEDYNYVFKRYYEDDQIETFKYIQDIDIIDIDKLGAAGLKEDVNLPLQTQSPFILTIDDKYVNGVTEPAVLEVEFFGQIYQHQNKSGEYVNKVQYTWDVRIISPGKGFSKNDYFRYDLDVEVDGDTETIELEFLVTNVKKVKGTKFDSIVPSDIGNNNSAQEILSELATKFKQTGIDKAIVVGNGLYLEDKKPFSVSTDEIAVADVMNSQKFDEDKVPFVRVNTVDELPLECYPGFVVEVTNSFDNKNNYYLQYQSESNTPNIDIAKSDGYWEEIAKPFEATNPISSTMPHMITIAPINDPDDTEDGLRPNYAFIVSASKWKRRSAGTSKDNPSIFLDRTVITEINYYKNRLLLMTGNGAVCSSQAGDVNDVFLKTAINTSLTDPIDFVANSNQRVPIHGSAVVNDGMVLFGASEQYRLSSDRAAFTAETVNITKVSNYSFSKVSKPIYLGTNVGFVSEGLSRFYEMTNIYESGPVDINERSQQVQTQFGRGFNIPASSREQSMAVFYKKYQSITDRSRNMYLYRFRQENSQDSSQTSWVKWQVDRPIAYVSMPQDKMFVVVSQGTETNLYKMDSNVLQGTSASSGVDLAFVPKYTDGWTSLADGQPFETRITFPTIYPRGKESYDITANTTVHRIKMSTAAIGAYNLEIKRKGYDTYNILVEQTPADDGQWGADIRPFRGEHIETVPVYTRNKNLTLTMSTEFDAPLTLHSMTWEGDWNPPYYKRV